MKIMVYSSAATFGGHELVSLKGLEALLDARHTLDVVCYCGNEVFVRALRQLEKRYPEQCHIYLRKYRMQSLQIIRTWISPLLMIELYKIIRSLGPDRVLMLQGDIEQGSEIAFPALLARVPSISYIPMVMNGLERRIRLARLRDVLSRPMYSLISRFVVISNYFKNQALMRGACDVRVVVNCVDESFYTEPVKRRAARDRLGIRDNECLSGFIGRISYQQKGIDRLLDLIAHDPDHFRMHRLIIVGGGPDMPRLLSDLEKRGIADCVILRPWEEERVAYFDAIDVFLCASRYEGVPLTILEALTRSVPVISTVLPALVGQLPLLFVPQEFDPHTVLTLLRQLQPRNVVDGVTPLPLLEGLEREIFNTAFVQAVVL